jgi:hypothetical protein
LFRNLKTQTQQGVSSGGSQDTTATNIQGVPLVGGSENDGNQNVYYGIGAGSSLTTGTYNSMFGYYAGNSTTTGSTNAFFGTGAGRSNVSGICNTFVGIDAGWNNTQDHNTFVGYYAGRANTSGYSNTIVGSYAGDDNTTGNYNTFLGYASGSFNTTGGSNTYIGDFAGQNNSTGSQNVCIGNAAGQWELGSHKLYIENTNTSTPLIYGEFNNDILCINGNLGIGTSNYTPSHPLDVNGYVRTKYFMQRSEAPQMRWYETDGPDGADFFKMNYHNSSLEFIWYDASSATTYLPIKMEGNGYVGINNANPSHMLDVGTSGAYCNGGAWVNGSSIEFKENVSEVELEEASDTLDHLRPVKYNYKDDKEEQHLGFIAEDVPELVAIKDRKGVSAMDMVSVLTKVVQDLKKKVCELRETNSNLIKRIEKLEDKEVK